MMRVPFNADFTKTTVHHFRFFGNSTLQTEHPKIKLKICKSILIPLFQRTFKMLKAIDNELPRIESRNQLLKIRFLLICDSWIF